MSEVKDLALRAHGRWALTYGWVGSEEVMLLVGSMLGLGVMYSQHGSPDKGKLDRKTLLCCVATA